MENLYGLIGKSLEHSFSPVIHEKILKYINIKGHYGLYEVKKENLKYVINGIKALGFNGINVTIPYKSDIIPYLDYLNPEASKIGAVNVVRIDNDGMAAGYNSDYYGFGMMLVNSEIKVNGEKAVILGTGGSSRAVSEYLKDNGIKEIAFVTRDVNIARLKYPVEKLITCDEIRNLKGYSTIINCTPVGMYPDTGNSPAGGDVIKNFGTAVDLVYNPVKTVFIKTAEAAGLKTANGIYMLAAQAVKSQEIWNDISIPESCIKDISSELEVCCE
jgi:shikimate dehydrogenase